MPKCISMYPGSSGSVTRKTNHFSMGNGNGKWQGLQNTTNLRSNHASTIRRRSVGNNRDMVFYVNQLGGVGRMASMFLSSSDGVSSQRSAPNVPVINAVAIQVTNSGSGSYLIDGVPNKELRLNTGVTYAFVVNAPGHPFWIKTKPGPGLSDTLLGLLNNGAENRTIHVVFDRPRTLYYACQYHASMGGVIIVQSTDDPTIFTPSSKDDIRRAVGFVLNDDGTLNGDTETLQEFADRTNATPDAVLDIASWDVSKVTDMGQLFDSDTVEQDADANTYIVQNTQRAPQTYNLNGWDVSNVTNMRGMFGKQGLNGNPFFNMNQWFSTKSTSIQNMQYMFYGSDNFFNTYIRAWDVDPAILASDVNSDGNSIAYQMFNDLNPMAMKEYYYPILIDEDGTPTSDFFNHIKEDFTPSSKDDIRRAVGFVLNDDGTLNGDAETLQEFADRTNATPDQISDIASWVVSGVTDMGQLFDSDTVEQDADANTYIVQNTQRAPQTYNLNGWDVSNVTNMRGMFGQQGLNGNPFFNMNQWFSTASTKIESMQYMFYGSSQFDDDSIRVWKVVVNTPASDGNSIAYQMFYGTELATKNPTLIIDGTPTSDFFNQGGGWESAWKTVIVDNIDVLQSVVGSNKNISSNIDSTVIDNNGYYIFQPLLNYINTSDSSFSTILGNKTNESTPYTISIDNMQDIGYQVGLSTNISFVFSSTVNNYYIDSPNVVVNLTSKNITYTFDDSSEWTPDGNLSGTMTGSEYRMEISYNITINNSPNVNFISYESDTYNAAFQYSSYDYSFDTNTQEYVLTFNDLPTFLAGYTVNGVDYSSMYRIVEIDTSNTVNSYDLGNNYFKNNNEFRFILIDGSFNFVKTSTYIIYDVGSITETPKLSGIEYGPFNLSSDQKKLEFTVDSVIDINFLTGSETPINLKSGDDILANFVLVNENSWTDIKKPFLVNYTAPSTSLTEYSINVSDKITVDISNIITQPAFYLPATLPAGDMTNFSNDFLYPLKFSGIVSSEPTHGSDQCRAMLRHGINAMMVSVEDSEYFDTRIFLKAMINGAFFTFEKDKNLALYIPIYTFKQTDPSLSGDVMGPYIAGLTGYGIAYSSEISKSTDTLGENILTFNNDGFITSYNDGNGNSVSGNTYTYMLPYPIDSNFNYFPDQYTAGMREALYSVYPNGYGPLYDAYKSGAQQMGLVAWGMGFSEPFLRKNWGSQDSPIDSPMLQLINTIRTTKLERTDSFGFDYFKNDNAINEYTNKVSVNYALYYLRGQQFYSFDEIVKNSDNILSIPTNGTYANIIGPFAYATSIRIRNINVSENNELMFGVNDNNYQPLTSDNVPNLPDNPYYVAPYFPIISTPDSGWGSCTMEIISYQGIAAVVRNDYVGFCRWHRLCMYLLNVQNGGFLNVWSESPDNAEYISRNTQTKGWSTDESNHPTDVSVNPGWCPAYLKSSSTNPEVNFADTPSNTSNFVIYKTNTKGNGNSWPPEGSDDSTAYWANRLYPYRGTSTFNKWKTGWTLPSWCLGFKPVWVAQGINNDTTYSDSYPDKNDIIDEDKLSDSFPPYKDVSPIFQAANPYFAAQDGLYTASDADMNMFVAYKLASLAWTEKPPINDYSSNNYDCDVADCSGVGIANAKFNSTTLGTFDGGNSTMTVSKAIGYGFRFNSDSTTSGYDSTPSGYYTEETYPNSGTQYRMFTWTNIAVSMARTMISKRGLANYDTPENYYGNFTNFQKFSKNIITLGHDTNESTIKPDYIDLAVMQLCAIVKGDTANSYGEYDIS